MYNTLGKVEDHLIRWELYAPGEMLCAKFSSDEWHHIVADIHSDKEWGDFLMTNPNFVYCYVLKRCFDNQSIAFIYILKEYDNERIISIHGGGWLSPVLYCRGYALILQSILEKGYKVRTYCSIDNKRSLRLSTGLGYVVYKKTPQTVYMWLSLRNLKRSRMYQRFYSDTTHQL